VKYVNDIRIQEGIYEEVGTVAWQLVEFSHQTSIRAHISTELSWGFQNYAKNCENWSQKDFEENMQTQDNMTIPDT
jgi:hypothetical protein